ncbi:MAG: hypothetical protein IJU94_02830 [Clostridia bacterium]|nr:hypothetical protein [Clostridia bacterium]
MKRSVFTKLLSCFLAILMIVPAAATVYAAEASGGKYVKDVFIAYGEDKATAEPWLRDNGWEPIVDLNDGKNSDAPGIHNAVAVLGIKRTDDPKEAITDMATMYMKGGYSFDDYESLVNEKKADITEFINTFVPALNEYRDNYNGKGSAGGQKRAQMAHDLLNKFFDGDPNGEYAINDTGKPLGDLLLNKTKTEIGDDAYEALSAEQKLNTADLQQIILESSGPAVLMIEQTLALATDTAETSWLERVEGLTGEALLENIADYAPEAAGQDLAPSAAMSLLASYFEDYSKILAGEWLNMHEELLWYEEYCDENGLWKGDDDDDAYASRVEAYFTTLNEESPDRFRNEFNRFSDTLLYYQTLKTVSYPGEWGYTLYDFFCPEDENAYYGADYDYFAPIAASLSAGQRAALKFLNISTLFKLALDSDSVMKAQLPKVDELFSDKDGKALESISIYSGINRAIFRRGVALTSNTLMQKAMGNDPYEDILEEGGLIDILAYSSFGAGALSMIAGAAMSVYSSNNFLSAVYTLNDVLNVKDQAQRVFEEAVSTIENSDWAESVQTAKSQIKNIVDKWPGIEKNVTSANKAVNNLSRIGTAGRWLMGIGGVLMLLAVALKAAQLYQFYHRTFTQIPIMIVDEADIVSYTTNDDGEKVKQITFDQFVYYDVVKCNRQQIGIHTNAQKGVSDYASWGCGDAADINADVGKQWLAIYTNRSTKKGSPILADSFVLRTGKEEVEKGNKATEAAKMPSGCNGCLHMFTSEAPVRIDHEKFCYRSDNNGMFLYWQGDTAAFTASSFGTGGTIAVSAFGGLIVGILGATLVLLPKRKKEQESTPAEA